MNYIIPTLNCCLFDKEMVALKKGVKYKIIEDGIFALVCGSENLIPFVLDLSKENSNVLSVKFEKDNFHFLFPCVYASYFHTSFKFKNHRIDISLSNVLNISINAELKFEQVEDNLTFSHYEECGEFCLIYFTGVRNFLVVIKDNEISYANYYDECNANETEKYFMCRLNDSLNHGKVCKIVDNEIETYLVYLDENEMHLKSAFVSNVFLDCVLAGNFKYCNELLCENLKLQDENMIRNFFPEFDYFYPLKENVFMLANKNTLAGIFEFSIDDTKIVNITSR